MGNFIADNNSPHLSLAPGLQMNTGSRLKVQATEKLLGAIGKKENVIFNFLEVQSLLSLMAPSIPRARLQGDELSEFLRHYDSAVKAFNKDNCGKVTFTPAQLELWANFYETVDPIVLKFEEYLRSRDADCHPLDGEYEPSQNYASRLTRRENGVLVCDKSSGDLADTAKLNFFCCLQLVEKLEERGSCLGRNLTSQEVHHLDTLLTFFGATLENCGLDQPLRETIQKADDTDSYLWVSHSDIAKILLVCGQIARPKWKFVAGRRIPDKYQHRPMRVILLSFRVDLKMNAAIEQKRGVILNFEEASDLFAFCNLAFDGQEMLCVDPQVFGINHPQVKGRMKLHKFLRQDGQEELILSAEETMAFHIILNHLFNCWEEGTYENPAYNFVCNEHQKDMFRFFERIRFFGGCIQDKSDVLHTIAHLLPSLNKTWKQVPRMLSTRVEDVYDEIEGLISERDEALKDCNRLRKSLKSEAMKEKKFDETDAKLAAIRDEKTRREEKLMTEVSRLEHELATAKTKLECTLGEPDKIRGEFSGKIQRLHDKVSAREKTIAENEKTIANEIEAHDTTKQELKDAQAKIVEQEKLLKKYKAGAMKIKKDYGEAKRELDEMKALHPSS